MTTPSKVNFKMYQGSLFSETIRWESATKIYVPISGITKAAPMIVTTVSAHNIPTGWRTKFSNIGGMKELNTDDYHIVTNKTSDTLEYNLINSLNYTAYTSGGVVEYNQPVDLAGYTARMQLRQKVTSTTVIDEYTTENSRIVINTNNKTIGIVIPASITETYSFKNAVYSLEMVNGSTIVPIIYGTISLIKEITR